MARPGEVYGGSAGRTRSEPVHWTCACGLTFSAEVHRVVNATRDPLIAADFREGGLGRATCPGCGEKVHVEVPVLYHDEARRALVLILPTAWRHRELEERAEVLLALARDRSAPVPAYARDFQVAYGLVGLRALLDAPAAREGDDDGRERALRRLEAEVTTRAAELRRERERLDARAREHAAHVAAVERRQIELRELAAALDDRRRELDASLASAPAGRAGLPLQGLRQGQPANAAPGDDPTAPVLRVDAEPADRVAETRADRLGLALGGTAERRVPERAEDSGVRPLPVHDAAVERWIHTRAPTAHLVDRGQVRLLTRLASDRLEGYLAGPLTARVQLHRLPTYPLVAVSLWPPEGAGGEPLAFHFDLQRIEDRQVLSALGTRFRFVVDLYDAEYLHVAGHEIEQPLGANLRYALTIAEDHLTAIPAARRSFEAAVAAWRAPAFDRWGRPHGLAEDSFSLLPSPAAAGVALAPLAGWCEPANEEYLLLVSSFPLDWWRRIRGRVVAKAVEYGLALPDTLVDQAVGEGLARSRRDLVGRQALAFAERVSGAAPLELDPAHVTENWRALAAWAAKLSMPLPERAARLAASALGAREPADPIGARAGRDGGAGAVGTSARPASTSPSAGATGTPDPRGARAGRTGAPVVIVHPAGQSGAGRAAGGEPEAAPGDAAPGGGALGRQARAGEVRAVATAGAQVAAARSAARPPSSATSTPPPRTRTAAGAVASSGATMAAPPGGGPPAGRPGRAADVAPSPGSRTLTGSTGPVVEPAVVSTASDGIETSGRVSAPIGGLRAATRRITVPRGVVPLDSLGDGPQARTAGASPSSLVEAVVDAASGRTVAVPASGPPGPAPVAADPAASSSPLSLDVPPGTGAVPRPQLVAMITDELLELLDVRELRRDAALELCRRRDPVAVGPIFGGLRRMTRGEAARVLPAIIGYGERAVPHLIDGLRSRKGYLRHGCALALGVLKSADGIEAISDLLLTEPTELWRELARALGEVGAGAVMSLAARLRDPAAQGAEARERVALALAHVAIRGGRGPVETLAAGRDAGAAAAARRALELVPAVRQSDAEVRAVQPAGELPIDRAFSHRFFATLERRAGRRATTRDGVTDTGSVALDESDLLPVAVDDPSDAPGDADALRDEWLDDEDLVPG